MSNWWWFIFVPLVISLCIAGGILGSYVYKRWFGPRWFPMLYEPKKLNRYELAALDGEMLARWGRMANDAEIAALEQVAELRRKLVAHHSMGNLSDEVISATYRGSGTGKCPVCRDVEESV